MFTETSIGSDTVLKLPLKTYSIFSIIFLKIFFLLIIDLMEYIYMTMLDTPIVNVIVLHPIYLA